MAISDLVSGLPASARKEQLETFVADIDRARRSVTAANLLLKHEACLSRPASAQLGAIMAEVEETLASLQDRKVVLMPKVRHEADNLDAAYDVAFDAHDYIRNLEALLDSMVRQLEQQPDGHLITIAELCREQMPKLRFALYGEDMGP